MTTMLTLAACAVLVLALLGAYTLGGGRDHERSSTDTSAAVRQVTSAGVGSAKGTPDVMRFTVGVDLTRADVGEAVDASNALMKKVLGSVRGSGVADKDIRTAQYSIDPRYDYAGNTERLIGYSVTQRASITLRELASAGKVITAVAKSGGNDVRVDAIAFEVSDPARLLDEARTDAVARARASAEIYAKAAGAELGEVISIKENSAKQRSDPAMYEMRDLAAAKAAPIEAGESELSVHLSVTWSLR